MYHEIKSIFMVHGTFKLNHMAGYGTFHGLDVGAVLPNSLYYKTSSQN